MKYCLCHLIVIVPKEGNLACLNISFWIFKISHCFKDALWNPQEAQALLVTGIQYYYCMRAVGTFQNVKGNSVQLKMSEARQQRKECDVFTIY